MSPNAVAEGHDPLLLVGFAREADLGAIVPDNDAIGRISEALDLIGFYVFAVTTGTGPAHATTRMFAPRYGIAEESATGMAAGPLACLLHDVLGDRRGHFAIEQGRFMSPRSVSRILVDLEIERGRITGLMAGGEGRRARTLDIFVPGDASPVQPASGQQSQ